MIISISGKKRSGKDTLANSIGFKKLSFADPLKDMLRPLGFTQDQLYGDSKEIVDQFWGITPRWIMQHLGTELMRDNFRDDIWIKCMEKRLIDTYEDCIIPDARFDNEVIMLKKMGAIHINVTGGIDDNHSSEKGINPDLIDYTFDTKIRYDKEPNKYQEFVSNFIDMICRDCSIKEVTYYVI